MRTAVRFRQFQSATSDEKLATKYRRREDGKGFLWTIDIPEGFVGARQIAEVAWREREVRLLTEIPDDFRRFVDEIWRF